jgi:c-di-GMP-binding flagellar brake protein YcgR
MFVLDEEKLNLILTEMAAGLARSPLEIAIFAVLVLSIVVAVVVLYRRQMRKEREEALGRSQRLFGQQVRKRRLSYAEVSILESLATYLQDPAQKHLLVENQNTFNTCARKLLDAGHASATEIAALRLKLGFRSRSPEQVFQSSAQLHEDMPVVVVQREKQGCRGKIDAVEPQLLGIEMGDGCAPFKRGHPVRVYFQTPAGRFAFSTKVRRVGKGRVELTHSESIKRLQRRQFYRKKLMLPVYVRHAGVQERAMLTSLIDLGGGGASLANRDMGFKVGDRIRLSVLPSGQDKIEATGEVIRISKDGKVAHIEFEHMMDSNRDRIMGLLFKPLKR